MSEKKKPKSGGKVQVEQLQAIRLEWYGGQCMHIHPNGMQCEVTFDLQLAHAKDTPLSIAKKSGRSSAERLKDVMENPECFLLFCMKHHWEFDGKNAFMWYEPYYQK